VRSCGVITSFGLILCIPPYPHVKVSPPPPAPLLLRGLRTYIGRHRAVAERVRVNGSCRGSAGHDVGRSLVECVALRGVTWCALGVGKEFACSVVARVARGEAQKREE